MGEIAADIRARLEPASGDRDRPADLAPHRPMLSGVRSQIAIKIFGEDLDTLRARPMRWRGKLAGIPGLADLEIEKQVLAPQIKVRVDYTARPAVWRAGAADPGDAAKPGRGRERWPRSSRWKAFRAGELRPPESAAFGRGARADILWKRPPAHPVVALATIEDGDGRPDQPRRRQTAHRLSANAQARAVGEIVEDIRAVVAEMKLPEGYFITLGGQFQAQEEASRLVGLLSIVSLVLMFVVLYSRWQVGASVGADHGQHSAALGRGDRPVDLSASRCRWRRSSASSRSPASRCVMAS